MCVRSASWSEKRGEDLPCHITLTWNVHLALSCALGCPLAGYYTRTICVVFKSTRLPSRSHLRCRSLDGRCASKGRS
ncbi:hypothetical protein HYPSUDRAFT_413377 [Hypholoma sublateritium FD-334 SS-4]|uniref:Uncharacterized protein n=1 Tax=Hypholoma sublateritium (strain FD-334 SS-4) TaxID=945553 RepID=A0A0D2NE18_HYPSF|nr:hypothetical protein HYPSUDRAFT_413377 [Hypholoma sublateritium FD-334 SS-4]